MEALLTRRDILLFLQARGQWLGATFKEPLPIFTHIYPASYSETRDPANRQKGDIGRRHLFEIPGLVFTESEKKRIVNHYNKQKQIYNKKIKDADTLADTIQTLSIKDTLTEPTLDIVSFGVIPEW